MTERVSQEGFEPTTKGLRVLRQVSAWVRDSPLCAQIRSVLYATVRVSLSGPESSVAPLRKSAKVGQSGPPRKSARVIGQDSSTEVRATPAVSVPTTVQKCDPTLALLVPTTVQKCDLTENREGTEEQRKNREEEQEEESIDGRAAFGVAFAELKNDLLGTEDQGNVVSLADTSGLGVSSAPQRGLTVIFDGEPMAFDDFNRLTSHWSDDEYFAWMVEDIADRSVEWLESLPAE